jgi:hypothetical protein
VELIKISKVRVVSKFRKIVDVYQDGKSIAYLIYLTSILFLCLSCTKVFYFTEGKMDLQGNGWGYEGKLTFVNTTYNFTCEGQIAPASILRRDEQDKWYLTVNTATKCAEISHQEVTDVSYNSEQMLATFEQQDFRQILPAPWDNTSLTNYNIQYVKPISTLTKDLIAYYQMNSGIEPIVLDNSGSGFDGTLANGATLKAEGTLLLDGLDDYLDVGKFDIAGSTMSISARFYSEDLANCGTNDCRIVSKAVGVTDNDHYFMVSTIKVGTATRLRFRLKTQGVTDVLIASSGDLSAGEWVHVVATYDGAMMRLFKNGIEVGSMAKNGDLDTNSSVSVWVGNNPPDSASRPFKGQIDDLRIYKRALTDIEINELSSTN